MACFGTYCTVRGKNDRDRGALLGDNPQAGGNSTQLVRHVAGGIGPIFVRGRGNKDDAASGGERKHLFPKRGGLRTERGERLQDRNSLGAKLGHQLLG